MATIASQRLDQLVLEIEAARVNLETGNYQLAAHLLALALLQIELQRNEVTDGELRALCELVDDRLRSDDEAPTPRIGKRVPLGRDRSNSPARTLEIDTSNLRNLWRSGLSQS